MNKDLENEFLEFRSLNFAENKKSWGPWFDFIAKDFYLSFLKNMDSLQTLIEPYLNRKKAELSRKEDYKIKIILSIFSLFKAINYDKQSRSISINSKILSHFSEITSKEEIDLLVKSQNELMSRVSRINDKKAEAFNDLIGRYNLVFEFYENKETRKTFFKQMIKDKDVEGIFSKIESYTTRNVNYISHSSV